MKFIIGIFKKNCFSDYINTICLPLEADLILNQSDEQVLVAGWGKDETLFRTQSLMKAKIPRQRIEKCRETFNRDSFTDSKIICAGGENQVDTCKGDSGGPLFWTGRVNAGAKYIQHGITAAGYKGCGVLFKNETPPALYTNVANFTDWITNNMH